MSGGEQGCDQIHQINSKVECFSVKSAYFTNPH